MAIYLCDITAFDFWFGEQATMLRVGSFPEVPDLADATATASELPERDLARWGLASYPVHVFVADHRSGRASSKVIAHVWSGPIPSRSFVRLSPTLYIEAPVPCVIHAARRLSAGRLLVLCNRLCASYRLDRGTLRECRPLATAAELRAYADAATGMRGIKRLRPLLPLVQEGAASPREAQLAALLRTSVHHGGCGLPAFIMNGALEVLPGDTPRFGDCTWPQQWAILEYESDEFHTGAGQLGRDSTRRAQLEAAGYRVYTLTNLQLMDEAEFLRVADLLRRRMGQPPLPADDASYLQRHRKLRREVLGA